MKLTDDTLEPETPPATETASSPTVPVHGFHANSPDWFAQQGKKIYEFFARDPAHKQEFETWQMRQVGVARISGDFNTFTENLNSGRAYLAGLASQIRTAVDCDLPKTIFNFVKANGIMNLPVIASDRLVSSVAILKEHGPKVLELAEAEQLALEKKFEAFKYENKAVLKDLGLI
jgi:hypothetical protein